MSDGTANRTNPGTRDEKDTTQDANGVQRSAAIQRAISFAQIDFVEFIRQRDMLRHVDLHRLMAVPIFYDTAADFWNGLVSLGAASSRVWNGLTKADIETIMPGAEHGSAPALASRAVALAGYCSMLPEGDQRHVALESRRFSDGILEKYVDWATGEPYLVRSAEDLSYRSDTETRDRQWYIIHWSRAFSESFDRVIENRSLLSRIYSASCHGADYVWDILGLAATELPYDLPCIDDRLRIELVMYIGSLRSQGLLLYHFDPEREFPSYFSEPPVRSG